MELFVDRWTPKLKKHELLVRKSNISLLDT